MKKMAQVILSISTILAAFNSYAADYSIKDHCVNTGSTVAAFMANKAEGKDINFSDFKHNMDYYVNKIDSADLKSHAIKLSDAFVSTIQERDKAELSKLYNEFNRSYQDLSLYFISLCNASFNQLSVDNPSVAKSQKSLDEIQKTSQMLVKSMNSYPGCEEYKKIILDNAFSDAPSYVRERRLEVHYQKVTQLGCL